MSKGTRICSKCKTEKALTDFFRDKSRSLGRMYVCKTCSMKSKRIYFRETGKFNEKYIKRHRQYVKNYIEANPDKSLAHQLAKKVKLPEACENCGSKSTLHRHHPDYSKPSDVVALCIPCHEAVHHRKLKV